MINNNSSNYNPPNGDMATAKVLSLQPFSGDSAEDVTIWVTNSKFLLSLFEVEEKTAKKLIFAALRGTAFEWARDTVSQVPNTSVEDLLTGLSQRFISRLKITETAQRFLSDEIPENIENFFLMMKDASYLYSNNYMSLNALVDRIISRSPSEIRIALWSTAGISNNMFEFAKAAERVVPLAYGKAGSMNAVNIQVNRVKQGNSKKFLMKFCELHGKKGHSTEECISLKKLAKNGWEKKNLIKASMVETEEKDNDKINALNYYSCHSNKYFLNPFQLRGKIQARQLPVLIDTGADVTLIPHKWISSKQKVYKTSQTARAANGKAIVITGEVHNIKLSIKDHIIRIKKAFLTSEDPGYILLGAPEIIENPKIMFEILKEKVHKKTEDEVQSSRNQCKINQIDSAKSLLISQEIELKRKYNSIFTSEISPTVLCTIKKHSIDTGAALPICQKEHRIQMHLEEKVDAEINKLKRQGIIQQSESPWRSSLVVVPKEGNKIRLCVDYRALNEVTTKNAYPLPRIDTIIDTLAKAKIFSVMDATSGYHQISLEEKDMKKTAFSWKGELYEFTRMPFGLCNAPATFQSIMNTVLKQENWVFTIPYLDDIIVFSANVEEHKKHLEIVLGKLKSAGLTLNSEKSKFFQTEVEFLGNVISYNCVKPDPKKIQALVECEPPKTLRDLRSFLGLANFCSLFIKHFATIASPLTDLLQGEVKASMKKINWTQKEQIAFETLKTKIAEVTSRSQPDKSKTFILTTDASSTAMGAVLSQMDDKGYERMIACFSKKFLKAQLNYSTTDKEALALEKGILHFDHYLRGKKFILKTDHQALQYIKTASNHNSRIIRAALRLQEYDFNPIYIKGETNIADILSRPQQSIKINASQSILNEAEKQTILLNSHNLTGHGSANKMKFLLQNDYQWEGIYTDIENFVKKCTICQKAGDALNNTKNRVIITKHPNELWEIDLIGRIPGENGTNNFIFIAIDHYTKWMETRKLNNKSVGEIIKAIKELIIDKHGIPKRILSDNGLEFKNNEVKKLMTELNIEWDFSSPRHHETVGGVERANQTLMKTLRKLTEFGRINWANQLKKATDAYNISFHRAINTSPYILKFGQTPKITGLDLKVLEFSKSTLMTERDSHFQKYQKAIKKGKKEIKNRLVPGDRVFIFNPLLSDKFKEKWHAGYIITKEILPDAYVVFKSGKEYRVNKKHIKKDYSAVLGIFQGEEVSYK